VMEAVLTRGFRHYERTDHETYPHILTLGRRL
jgi:hypothetical protein